MFKIIFVFCFVVINVSCTSVSQMENTTLETSNSIILATTTSTQDSGLLDYILPIFTNETGIDVMVVAVGTGKAFEIAKAGDADVLLVHAKSRENEFISAGYGVKRYDVMYNDFILIGPSSDPANIKELASNDIEKSLSLIKNGNYKFVSRADNSGTDIKEKSFWKNISTDFRYKNYIETGKGMGETLIIADEMLAYILTDRATYLNMREKLDLEIICQGDQNLFNQYGVIKLNNNINDKIKTTESEKFINWIISAETQDLIGEYGVEKFGQPLFIPNASK